MEAEYFPPKADVILENQTTADFYILVSGAVDFVSKIHGHDQVLGKAITGDIFCETGVLCNMPQRLTVRTTEISQVLRLSRTKLTKLIRANTEDGDTIRNNLFQKLKGTESFRFAKQWNDPNLKMGV